MTIVYNGTPHEVDYEFRPAKRVREHFDTWPYITGITTTEDDDNIYFYLY